MKDLVLGHLVEMTIDKDYANDDDQQVPEASSSTSKSPVTSTSAKETKERKSSLPDFDTLLVDLVSVGALDPEALKEGKDMELSYGDRSFYDDYVMQHMKREDTAKDFYPGEYVTSSDLSFLPDETGYGYGFTQMPLEPGLVDGQDVCMKESDVIQKIERASLELGISKNPYQWEAEHSHRWAEWALKLYNISHPTDFFMDGTSVCMLSQADFQRRCPEYGEYLYAELELWKSAYYVSSSPMHSDEEEMRYQAIDDLTCQAPLAQLPQHPMQQAIPTSVIMPPRNNFIEQNPEPTLLQAVHGHSRHMSGGGCISRPNLSSPASSLGSAGDLSWSSASPDHQEEMQESLSDLPSVGRGKHAIHLWQFLKELLLQPHAFHGCIRWLDRNRGIFKIEDSARVAKLWGQRKNRPAMNYDKLSRSIRQYYKKGIIKKTENSKRLVYQFQPQYR